MTNLINTTLETLTSNELKNLAKEFKVKNWWTMKKAELLTSLTELKEDQQDAEAVKKANEELTKEGAISQSDTLEPSGEDIPKEPKKPGNKKAKTPKVEKDEENLVTIKELASDYHMKGAKARRLLRNSGIARPYGGNRWEWDKEKHQEMLEAAREFLEAHSK